METGHAEFVRHHLVLCVVGSFRSLWAPALQQALKIISMKFNTGRLVLIAACVVWASVTATGLSVLWRYENAPGPAAIPPTDWPSESRIQRASERATLIMLAHPHCPCTRASIEELNKLMAQAQGHVTAYVLFLKPTGSTADWEKTDLWQSAARIPGVNVVADDSGNEARRFHAVTSGQTALYDSNGHLLFSGGITSARGHSGDNAGRSAIVSLLNTRDAEVAETAVFGCPLYSDRSECLEEANEH